MTWKMVNIQSRELIQDLFIPAENKKNKTKTARILIEDLEAALHIYRIALGRYPTTKDGLQALVQNTAGAANWNGPYLKKNQVPKDPWGFNYHYHSPGEHGSFDLWSLGADNREGGEGENQDILGWE